MSSSAARAWLLLAALGSSCTPEPWYDVDARPINLLRAPVRADDPTPGAVLARARLRNGESTTVVVDTSAVLSGFRGRPCTATDGPGWLYRSDLAFVDALHPGEPVRAIFRDIDLFDFCIGAVGSDAFPRPSGIIGGTLLGNFSVEFVLPAAYTQPPTVSLHRGLPGEDEAWEISGYSVLRFPLTGTVTVTTPARDKTVEVGVDTVSLSACAAPDAFAGQEPLAACETAAAASRAGRGVDLQLALGTGVGPVVLAESAWKRVAAALGAIPEDGVVAPLHVPSSDTPIPARWVTIPRLALVNDQAGELGPCAELARSRRLQSAHARSATEPVCLEECDATTGGVRTAAYLEVGGMLPVAVVADSSRIILDVNPNLPFDPYVDGIVGMAALAGTRFEVDYVSRPSARVVARCEPGATRQACHNVGRCVRDVGGSSRVSCFGQEIALPRCRDLRER